MLSRTFSAHILGWTTLTLGVFCAVIVTYAFTGYDAGDTTLPGYVLRSGAPKQVPWRIITAPEIMTGATIPADTNVIFELPKDSPPILRKTLLSIMGEEIRYWGYCLPENYDKTDAMKVSKLPGKMFLSEAERKARQLKYEQEERKRLSLRPGLSEDALNGLKKAPQGTIYHQFETFDPGSTCYIMTEKPLPIGTDPDDDGLNNQQEKDHRTDSYAPDTDGDGLIDGCEVQLRSSPVKRDTDGDGLIDSIEDANSDCHYFAETETDPLAWDTDRDGLPDGLMKMGNARNTVIKGEDKNLNGTVDEGESDPRMWSTSMDGISDGQKYYQCILEGGTDC
ncbi:MAG: hypothetical protein PHE68_01395 [Candidatus Peribacteraceae bacterium]|nr:hypothetical protein [Candidatus Peribacteraceae bacterium]MDD5075000.1 hypothetical protein [Candidatus Peribacteraceae bacterium]